MPELPEVETICNQIKPAIIDKIFTKIIVNNPKLRIAIPENIAEILQGQKIVNVLRRAKYIKIYLENGSVLLIHLGMSGTLIVKEKYQPLKHDHFLCEMDDGNFMIFNDPRRFGLITTTTKNKLKDHKLFSHLGIEPLSQKFDKNFLYEKTRNRNIAIKKFIMDQNILVGVGNIYASEALFLSKIHPEKPANKITKNESNILQKNIKITLQDAIKAGGSTISDFKSSDGSSGYFQHNFQVYNRENKPCYKCKSLIERITQGGRSSFFCPKCQKGKIK